MNLDIVYLQSKAELQLVATNSTQMVNCNTNNVTFCQGRNRFGRFTCNGLNTRFKKYKSPFLIIFGLIMWVPQRVHAF